MLTAARTCAVAGLFALTAAGLLAATGLKPLRAMQWLKADGGAPGMAAALSYDPGICLDKLASDQAKLGALLFGNPAVLGGQAAKARLTCASCHIDGADNPFFHFPGASGAAGTADVSNSFFSAAGANDAFDPVRIPNLAQPGKISRRDPKALETFLQTLIVKEFEGSAPSEETITALSVYIRSLVPCAQTGSVRQGNNLEVDMAHVTLAQKAAMTALTQGDYDSERLYIAAARDRLGLIHERYAPLAIAAHAKAVEKASAALGEIQNFTDPSRRARAYQLWEKRFQSMGPKLIRAQQRSYYNKAVLQAALEQSPF
jgi:hypothetical protein